MALNVATLKRSTKTNFEKLNKELEKINTNTKSYEDNRFWKLDIDKAGNGHAIIRFLPGPAVDGEDALPWVRIFDHGFKGPGGWYIENSLTTLGKPDPVSEYNTKLWNSGIEANKDIARKQKRRLRYVSNILVVQDPKHPENNDKVFLYKYGKKIFDKLSEKMNPPFEDEVALNPFDLWTGANFRLKVRLVEGFINYDKSSFDEASEILDGDTQKLDELWKSEYSLKEFLDPKNFKSYEELDKKLDRVLGLSKEDQSLVPAKDTSSDLNEEDVDTVVQKVLETGNKETKKVPDDDKDMTDYFQSLADDE